MALGFTLDRADPASRERRLARRVWRHSIMRGCLASALCQHACERLSPIAFVAGLMLDAGQPVLARLLGAAALDVLDRDLPPHASLAAETRDLPFTQANVMRYAKTLLKAGMEDKPVTEEIEAALGNYQKAHEEMLAVLAANPKATEHTFGWSSFESGAKEFLVAAKERFRRVRDKVPYSTGEKMNLGGSGEWMVDGSPGKLLRAYNDLVDNSNRLDWSFP